MINFGKYWRFLAIVFLLVFLGQFWTVPIVYGQSQQPASERLKILKDLSQEFDEASISATQSADLQATTSALVKKVLKKEPDLTEPKPEVKGKLENILLSQKLDGFSIFNFFKHGVRLAVAYGVPANTIVLILLFPLVAAWVAFTRHVVGLAGFGIFTPAILAVVFLATGIVSGVILFASIIFASTLSRLIFKKVNLQYLPRMALLLWFVSLVVFGLLLLGSFLPITNLAIISIFPILIAILLTETFIEVQIKEGMRPAMAKTLITVMVAIGGYGILQLEFLQKFVLLQPEIFVLTVALFDIILGKYTGLRWMEYFRFRQILKLHN